MAHIVRALVVWVLLLAGCLALFVTLARLSATQARWVDVEGPILAGAVAAWFAVQFGRAAFRRLRERALVGSADQGGRPHDGAYTVVRGVLHAASPMTTPFTGQAAVAYAYKAWRREKSGPSQKNTWDIAYWWGEGSTPAALLTRHGSLDVRSRLELEMWPALVESSPAAQACFDGFMRGGQPVIGAAGIARPGFEWNAPLDGQVRRDRLRRADPPPLADLTLHEWFVAPGEPVVLMGRYSAARGGLIHDERRGRPLRVLKGDTGSVRAQFLKGALAYGTLASVAASLAALFAGSILGWHSLGL